MTRHILSIRGKSNEGDTWRRRQVFTTPVPPSVALFIDITVGALTTPRVVYWLSHEGTTIKLDRALK